MNSGFFYKSAEEREKLVKAERKFIEERVHKIIELKKKVCADHDKGFVVINQKVTPSPFFPCVVGLDIRIEFRSGSSAML